MYTYAIEVDSIVDTMNMGRFRTPVAGPFSFTIAFSACADTGSNHAIFDTIRRHQPLLYLNTGDLHYEDISTNDRERFRQAYERVLAQPRQATLYRLVPIAYMWDDHDYGPNDSDATAPGRTAARLTYQEYVPHYPLAAGSGDVAIYQAFTIGRVRFIMTDTRSERSPKSMPDTAAKTMLGTAQKAWFKQQLLDANGVYPVIVWVCASPWLADLPGSGDDNWAGYATERRELTDFIETAGIQGLIMLSGDVHMLAIDDGRNNRYGASGERGFPIMQAAPLDRSNSSSLPDNIYSEGQFPGHQQFGLMSVEDDGGEIVRVRWSGRNANDEELVRHEMIFPPQARLALSPPALTFLSVVDGLQILNLPLTIANVGVGAMNWTITPHPPEPWLTIDQDSGNVSPGESTSVDIRVNPTGMAHGLYTLDLQIDGEGATYSPQLVTVKFLNTAESPIYSPLIVKE